MKKKHFIPLMLVFIGLALLFGCSSQAKLSTGGVTLKLKPQQGQTYTVTSTINAMTMVEVQGQTMNMSQSFEIRQSLNAKEVTNEQSVFETQIEAMKMTMSQMGMKLEYDSEHPEKTSPMLASQISELEKSLKKPIFATYNALGKIVGDETNLEMNQLSSIIIELPEKELTVGSKWTFKNTQSVSNTEFDVNMEYTVTAISKKSVDVSFTGGAESKEINGTYNGTASIDPQTGMIMSSTMKSNVSTTINEQGMSMPITVVGTTTIEVK